MLPCLPFQAAPIHVISLMLLAINLTARYHASKCSPLLPVPCSIGFDKTVLRPASTPAPRTPASVILPLRETERSRGYLLRK